MILVGPTRNINLLIRRIVFAGLILTLTLGVAVAQNNGESTFGYTYHQPSGNRVVEGAGNFPDVQQIEIPLGSIPAWLVGVAMEDGPTWVVVDTDGQVIRLTRGPSAIALDDLPPGTPPVISVGPEAIQLLLAPSFASPLSHPIPTEFGPLYIADNGDVGLLIGDLDIRLAVNAMLDARLVVSAEGYVAVYSDPTTERYVHGIMGDDLEAASISIIEIVNGAPQLVNKIELPGTAVFEGLSPIWADVNGDGADDLIVTISDSGLGAQVVIMTREGDIITEGPAIGQSNRWRHQLAWAALGEDGQSGLVEVLTPHIGGILGFFPLPVSGVEMRRTVRGEGFTSHVIGSRNLDMAVIGDFNGDGQMEVVLPAQNRTRIAGLQMRGDAFEEVWSLPLEGRLTTNLSAVALPDGSLALAAGTDAGTVYLWLAP